MKRKIISYAIILCLFSCTIAGCGTNQDISNVSTTTETVETASATDVTTAETVETTAETVTTTEAVSKTDEARNAVYTVYADILDEYIESHELTPNGPDADQFMLVDDDLDGIPSLVLGYQYAVGGTTDGYKLADDPDADRSDTGIASNHIGCATLIYNETGELAFDSNHDFQASREAIVQIQGGIYNEAYDITTENIERLKNGEVEFYIPYVQDAYTILTKDDAGITDDMLSAYAKVVENYNSVIFDISGRIEKGEFGDSSTWERKQAGFIIADTVGKEYKPFYDELIQNIFSISIPNPFMDFVGYDKSYGYTFLDIDGDGTYELLIGNVLAEDDKMDGKAEAIVYTCPSYEVWKYDSSKKEAVRIEPRGTEVDVEWRTKTINHGKQFLPGYYINENSADKLTQGRFNVFICKEPD